VYIETGCDSPEMFVGTLIQCSAADPQNSFRQCNHSSLYSSFGNTHDTCTHEMSLAWNPSASIVAVFRVDEYNIIE
jgi:hypothetical protein